MNPELTVIVPAVNTAADLLDCLTALDSQREDTRLEVIVVNRLGGIVREAIGDRFSWTRLLDVTRDTTIPQMRAIGFRAATGRAVAVIEDHVIVPAGWAHAMLAALDGGQRIVGGSIENAATGTLVDWAAFLCEYSHCIPPIAYGSVGWLTGNNVVYAKELLDSHAAITDAGQWEHHLHDILRAEGVELHCRPEIVVGHKKHYTFAEYFSQRYLFARSYAGARVAAASLPVRVAYGLAAFALPPVLLYRTVTRLVSKKRHLGVLVRAIPLMSVFMVAWGAGEVVGYFAGPGDSLRKVC
jgi:hypothetical protein